MKLRSSCFFSTSRPRIHPVISGQDICISSWNVFETAVSENTQAQSAHLMRSFHSIGAVTISEPARRAPPTGMKCYLVLPAKTPRVSVLPGKTEISFSSKANNAVEHFIWKNQPCSSGMYCRIGMLYSIAPACSFRPLVLAAPVAVVCQEFFIGVIPSITRASFQCHPLRAFFDTKHTKQCASNQCAL